MPGSAACSRCGATLVAFATEGFCSACMLEAGIGPAPASASVEVASSRQRFGDYELIEEIARGGMGVVFKARQFSLGRVVAIKMILTGRLASEVEVRRFRDEARAAAALHHPNIVAIHEVGEVDGQPYFSMDLVEGRNLAEALRDGLFAPARAASCVRAIAGAIQYAHEHGILHRDLKPSNVLLDREDRPHVTDFGLAKKVESRSELRVEGGGVTKGGNSQLSTPDPHNSLTLSGQVLGSPNFMPPEQALGKRGEVGPASDVYALGALLYHLLNGRPPFLADSVPATLRLVMETEPASPRLLTPTIPRDLETICLKCLQKDPHRRYATAREFADELGRFLRDEPICARPIGPWEKLHRWTRRHPVIAALTGIIGLLLIAVAAISTVAAARLQRANRAGQETLRDSYLAQARANRWGGRPGRRFDSLDVLAKAAAIRPGLDLRSEAVAAMALVDFRPTKSWVVEEQTLFGFDAAYILYVRARTNGTVTLHRVADDHELARHSALPMLVRGVSLSPSGAYFSVHSGTNLSRFDLFRWSEAKPLLTLTNLNLRSHAFSRDERMVAIAGTARVGKSKYRVTIVDLPSGQTRPEFDAHALPSVCFSPDGDKLAVYGFTSPRLEIREVSSGALLQTLSHGDVVHTVSWHPDGKRIASGCQDRDLYIWDLTQPTPTATRYRHHATVTLARFSPDGELMVSAGWADPLRLWEVKTGREIIRQPVSNAGCFPFSSDGGQLGIWSTPHRLDLCELAPAREVRQLHANTDSRPDFAGCNFSPDRRLLASTHSDGMHLWEMPFGREIALLPGVAAQGAVFGFAGDSLITSSAAGLQHWTVAQRRIDGTNVLELAPALVMLDGTELGRPSLDRHARRVAVCRDGWLEVLDIETGRSLVSGQRQEHIVPALHGATLNPRGDLVAAWGGGAHVWNLADQNPGRLVAPGASGVTFSPDERWLVAGTISEYVYWDTRTWLPGRRIPRPDNAGVHALAVFSPNGATVALRFTERTIGLYDDASGRHLVTLESPSDSRLGPFSFSADGDLFAAVDADRGAIILWDLRAIRQGLARIGLDWEAPPLPPAHPSQAPEEWRLTLLKVRAPPRDPSCGTNLIDLGDHFNCSFHEGGDNGLDAIPTGLQIWAGTAFDIRALVTLTWKGRPQLVTGIAVGRQCRSLNFLHSVGFTGGRGNVVVGEYVVHYADGKTQVVPLRNRENIDDWWMCPSAQHALDTNTTVVAWQGENAASRHAGCVLQIYKFRWDNPRPEVLISTVDFKSAKQEFAPSLLAITAE